MEIVEKKISRTPKTNSKFKSTFAKKVPNAHKCCLRVTAVVPTHSAIRVQSFQGEYGLQEDAKLRTVIKTVPSSLSGGAKGLLPVCKPSLLCSLHAAQHQCPSWMCVGFDLLRLPQSQQGSSAASPPHGTCQLPARPSLLQALWQPGALADDQAQILFVVPRDPRWAGRFPKVKT